MLARAPLAIGLAGLTLVSACTTTPAPGTTTAARSGGGYCGFYSGSKGGSGSGAQDVVRERRCFASLAACRVWFKDVQTRAPSAFVRKPCR